MGYNATHQHAAMSRSFLGVGSACWWSVPDPEGLYGDEPPQCPEKAAGLTKSYPNGVDEEWSPACKTHRTVPVTNAERAAAENNDSQT